MEQKCSICKKGIFAENDTPVLTVGGFGNVKYLCEECDSELSTATSGKDVEKINAALDNIGKKLSAANNDDRLVLSTLKEIMKEAGERAEKIKSGEYDFSEEEAEEEVEEIPEELLESEEDRERDRVESERNKKLDKIMNWIYLAVVLAAVGFLIYRALDTYFLN